ncbi:hypothetical protein K432DRAFT_401477 [Lepidopterella palustris CBS 459.81]|uniref:Uncharacterized protein n=1 Tax=Lepidopterella palustris CBS 459.81 TaxID=1314670 RepID=A0A8E2EHJ1_9PEZI|nr:hypothetical protein K432DRAFT_401477 [Lepidopterella palustris CBS 459.81]
MPSTVKPTITISISPIPPPKPKSKYSHASIYCAVPSPHQKLTPTPTPLQGHDAPLPSTPPLPLPKSPTLTIPLSPSSGSPITTKRPLLPPTPPLSPTYPASTYHALESNRRKSSSPNHAHPLTSQPSLHFTEPPADYIPSPPLSPTVSLPPSPMPSPLLLRQGAMTLPPLPQTRPDLRSARWPEEVERKQGPKVEKKQQPEMEMSRFLEALEVQKEMQQQRKSNRIDAAQPCASKPEIFPEPAPQQSLLALMTQPLPQNLPQSHQPRSQQPRPAPQMHYTSQTFAPPSTQAGLKSSNSKRSYSGSLSCIFTIPAEAVQGCFSSVGTKKASRRDSWPSEI